MERPQHDHLKATADEPHQPAYPLPTPWLWGGVDVVAVDVDDDLLQAVQFAYDPGDAHPGGVLEVAGYGQGGLIQGDVTSVDGDKTRSLGWDASHRR